MRTPKFTDLTTEEQDWLDAYLDETISPEEFAAFEDRLAEKPELRVVLRRYLSLDHALYRSSEEAADDLETNSAAAAWLTQVPEPPSLEKVVRWPSFLPLAAAAGIAFLLGSIFMGTTSFFRGETVGKDGEAASAQGFAVIERLFDAVGSPYREGDLLGSEVFSLASGSAEIQFFSGATMMVEGPAEIELRSAWEAACRDGAVRMKVPPAARGFKLQTPSTEIIDLGTEFGIEVRDGIGNVEVFDGEIAVRHEGGAEALLEEGAALSLAPNEPMRAQSAGKGRFPDGSHFGERTSSRERSDFLAWEKHSDALAQDERLIAYYTFDNEVGDGRVSNLTTPGDTELDGAVILAEEVSGRWPGLKNALEFRRPGARVRVNIPGEFPAFTFAAWVRIDSLDRWYSSLFMGDGYENGEPHWQIRDDGAMMLSVMIDDTFRNPKSPHDAGLHRVYFSPSIWDLSMSGRWMHLVSVFDPKKRAVSHFVNGEKISSQEIEDRFFTETLRIGNGEIGNWGQPFREDPTFAIRNLNGRVDEMAIFRVALEESEIAALYEQSRKH